MKPIENRVLVLITHEDQVYYCDKYFIAASNFEGRLPQSFTMYRVKSFDHATGTLTIKIEGSRQLNKEDYLINSKSNADLFSTLGVKKMKVYGYLRPASRETLPSVQKKSWESSSFSKKESVTPIFLKEKEADVEKNTEFTAIIPVVELTFGNGIISFLAFAKEVSSHIRFEVPNLFAKPEFNSIKKYFAKQYESGKTTAKCQVRYLGTNVLETKVVSHDLEKINNEIMSTVLDDLISDYIIDFESEEIRSLEDSLEDVYEIPEENVEQWLMSKLSNENLTKHHEHLMYLSGLHERNLFPLKVTGKPISFIFGIQKEADVFIVWETHNTKEATYLWRLPSELAAKKGSYIDEVENTVKMLRQGNKRSYRAANKKNDDFRVVEHDYSLPDNGFEKWRTAVNEFISR